MPDRTKALLSSSADSDFDFCRRDREIRIADIVFLPATMTVPDHPQSILLDVHAHLVPALPLDGTGWDPVTQAMTLDGHPIGPQQLFQPDALIAWMDENRIGHAWISIPPPAYRPQLDGTAARDWFRYVNDGLTEIAENAGGRLSALLHLPVEHPALAAEIASMSTRFSMAASAGPHIRLSDPAYEPLWTALDAQSAFLFIHPGNTCDPRLDRYFLRNLLGNPVETGIAAAHLLMSGVLQQHPAITICLAHGGGVLAAIAGRIDHAQSAGMITDAVYRSTPAEGLRRFCADCITHSPSVLHTASEIFGEDHLYFGSDWPFPMGLLDPHRQLESLEPTVRRSLFELNPGALLARIGRGRN